MVGNFNCVALQRSPNPVGDLVVASYDGSGPRLPGQDSRHAFLTEIDKTLRIAGQDRDGFEFVFAHGLAVAFEAAKKPGVGDISGENNVAVPFADQVTRGMERGIEVIEAYLVELLPFVHANDIVTEGHEGHMDGRDPAEQIRIDRPVQNESVNQAMVLKNGRQIDPIRRRSAGIMPRSEHDLRLHAGDAGFTASKDARTRGMGKA